MREVTSFANCLPLQNLIFPFASLVRRDNKFRVFFLFFGVRNFRTFTVIQFCALKCIHEALVTCISVLLISVPDPRDPRADYQEIPMHNGDQDIKGKTSSLFDSSVY